MIEAGSSSCSGMISGRLLYWRLAAALNAVLPLAQGDQATERYGERLVLPMLMLVALRSVRGVSTSSRTVAETSAEQFSKSSWPTQTISASWASKSAMLS
jgi:hypothetical protein